MILKDVMTPGVEVITPEATLQQAAAKMRRLNIGSCTSGLRITFWDLSRAV
jgi:hypothetical protein